MLIACSACASYVNACLPHVCNPVLLKAFPRQLLEESSHRLMASFFGSRVPSENWKCCSKAERTLPKVVCCWCLAGKIARNASCNSSAEGVLGWAWMLSSIAEDPFEGLRTQRKDQTKTARLLATCMLIFCHAEKQLPHKTHFTLCCAYCSLAEAERATSLATRVCSQASVTNEEGGWAEVKQAPKFWIKNVPPYRRWKVFLEWLLW